MVGDTIGERVDLVGRSLALLYIGLLGGCSSWLPESATQENQIVLYGEFYKANLGDDFERADHLARKLELCGRQLYLKDKGFFTALGQQDEHGDDTSIAEVVDLFTEDACKVPDAASPSKASDGSRRSATTGPGASAHDLIEAGAFRLNRPLSDDRAGARISHGAAPSGAKTVVCREFAPRSRYTDAWLGCTLA